MSLNNKPDTVDADNTTSFKNPTGAKDSVSYVSDPAKPVPYRTLLIEAIYTFGSCWDSWHAEDQRFVSTRPDVIRFTGDSLEENFTVTGTMTAHRAKSVSKLTRKLVIDG